MMIRCPMFALRSHVSGLGGRIDGLAVDLVVLNRGNRRGYLPRRQARYRNRNDNLQKTIQVSQEGGFKLKRFDRT